MSRKRLDKRQRRARRAAIRAALGLTTVAANMAAPLPEGSDIRGSDDPHKMKTDALQSGANGFRYPNAKLGSQGNAAVIQRFGKRKIVPKYAASKQRFHGMGDKPATAIVGHRLAKRKHRVVISRHTWKGPLAGSTPVMGYDVRLRGGSE